MHGEDSGGIADADTVAEHPQQVQEFGEGDVLIVEDAVSSNGSAVYPSGTEPAAAIVVERSSAGFQLHVVLIVLAVLVRSNKLDVDAVLDRTGFTREYTGCLKVFI